MTSSFQLFLFSLLLAWGFLISLSAFYTVKIFLAYPMGCLPQNAADNRPKMIPDQAMPDSVPPHARQDRPADLPGLSNDAL